MTPHVETLLDRLEHLDKDLGTHPAAGPLLAERAALIHEIAALAHQNPQLFTAAHRERLTVSWQKQERWATELRLQRQLLAAEFTHLQRDQNLYDRIQGSLCPDRTSWEMAG